MLPAEARLRRSEDFRKVLRTGLRAGRRRLVVHVRMEPELATVRVGFVVSKAVGNSVVRHRVARRLRHRVAERLGTLPPGCSLVVRALPPAATATSTELEADLASVLRRLGLSPSGDGVSRRADRRTVSDPVGGTGRQRDGNAGEDGSTV